MVLTNPEMLHVGILPHHARWATFFLRLRYVVIDELHMLRGIFGTHVAHLLRRLRRLCAHYGSAPTFVFSSATIGEPGRLASELCGLPVEEVTDDGSPGASGSSCCGTLPATTSTVGDRPSSARDTAELMAELVAGGHRTIAFCRSRKGTELVAADVRRRLRTDLADAVRPYRGGYLAAERREIERELFGGAPARRGRHHRARARHRRRRARRLRAQRLPRHHRLDVAAGGPGRARARRRRSPCWWPATTSSTSGSWPTPTRSSPARPSRR